MIIREEVIIPLEYTYINRLILFKSSVTGKYSMSKPRFRHTPLLYVGRKGYYVQPRFFGDVALQGYRKSV